MWKWFSLRLCAYHKIYVLIREGCEKMSLSPFSLANLLVRFPNPLAPAQLGNRTTSSLSQQGGYILQKWKAASICQVISTGQHHNPHRHQVSIEFVSSSARVAPFKSQKQEWCEWVLRVDSCWHKSVSRVRCGSCKVKVVIWKYQCSFLRDSRCCRCTCACVRSNSVTMSDDPASGPQVSWCQTESVVDASS